ncbi:PadR family transcriptional regulator [Amycolatopsis sp. WAC 01375]|uniref:PadR family transcriptional regulator n=1 Tax=Amycolatopsis sp. WAC 01375 TaxID=2203194 RepID=UPI000F78F0B2|nr:PadR family transcriptional regulator [Amycolatopsis sp. WAC 01375]RSM76874.1 PadR family transcriptional regulator [Amycolatopsis sp. WAC 01375]
MGEADLTGRTKKLTTVSYGVLGLLGLRPHTPYELAQQFKRSGTFWASAESVVYNEPKALVAHGLATAAAETNGGRRRTRYSITRAGRRELRRWLSDAAAEPQFQFDAMMKVLFSDLGDKDDLLGAIEATRAWADRTQAGAAMITHDYATGDEPYPDRAHIVGLTQAYRVGLAQMTRQWADWAEEQVRDWPDTHSGPTPAELLTRLGEGRTPW